MSIFFFSSLFKNFYYCYKIPKGVLSTNNKQKADKDIKWMGSLFKNNWLHSDLTSGQHKFCKVLSNCLCQNTFDDLRTIFPFFLISPLIIFGGNFCHSCKYVVLHHPLGWVSMKVNTLRFKNCQANSIHKKSMTSFAHNNLIFWHSIFSALLYICRVDTCSCDPSILIFILHFLSEFLSPKLSADIRLKVHKL